MTHTPHTPHTPHITAPQATAPHNPLLLLKLPAGMTVARCETMADVRAHIDALDAQIVPLVAQRSGYVAQAARIKQSSSQIVDEARIDFIVNRVSAQAEALGAPPQVLAATYRAMIAAFIEFERGEFARLRAKGEAPAAAPLAQAAPLTTVAPLTQVTPVTPDLTSASCGEPS